MVVQACYLSTWEAVVGRLGVQGHHWVYNEFQAILDYVRAYLTKQTAESGSEKIRWLDQSSATVKGLDAEYGQDPWSSAVIRQARLEAQLRG